MMYSSDCSGGGGVAGNASPWNFPLDISVLSNHEPETGTWGPIMKSAASPEIPSATRGGELARTSATLGRNENSTRIRTTKRTVVCFRTLKNPEAWFVLVPIGCSTSVAGRSLVLRRETPGFANPHHCGGAICRWLAAGAVRSKQYRGTCDQTALCWED